MAARRVVGLLIVATGLLTACAPSLPSSSPSSPSAVLSGRVDLSTNHPDGTMLVVNPCPGEGNQVPCTHDLEMSFSVVLNRDIERARVWTEFYTATGRMCGGASTAFGPLTAGTPATLTASSTYLSFQGAETPQCGLPVRTTRMVAHVLDWRNGQSDLLTQEFSKVYTFTDR